MVSKERVENNARGTINYHIDFMQASLAVGENEKEPIAYIYNIPSHLIEKDLLAVFASKEGGRNPEVAQPNPGEYIVGFECPDCTEKDIHRICKRVLAEIGLSTKRRGGEKEEISYTDRTAKIDLQDEI